MNNNIFPCSSFVFDSNKAYYVNSANNHTNAIFKDIDFRMLLGDSFELGAKYNLIVCCFLTNKSSGTNMASGNLNVYKMISSPAMNFNFYSYYKSTTSDFTKQSFFMFPHRYTTTDNNSYYSEVSMCSFVLEREMADVNINTYYPNTQSNSPSNSISYPYFLTCDIYKLKQNNNKLQIYKPLMLNQKIVSLRLATTDISTSDTAGDFPLENAIGYIDEYRDEMTFKNINMRQILGPELFEKHEYFNICLIHTIYGANTFGTNAIDKLIRFEIGGLPWVNNTYYPQYNFNAGFSVMGTMKLGTTATTQNYSYANVATFRKCEIINLTVRFIRYDGVYCDTTAIFPKIDMYFKIYPCI